MKSLRIVLLATVLDYGGAERQVVALATRLRARGHCVAVVSMRDPLAFADELRAADVRVHSLEMRRGWPDPRALLRLRRILRDHAADVLHSHMYHANLLARLTRPSCVVLCSAHNENEGGRMRMLAYRMTDSLCDLTTNVGDHAVRRFVKIGAVPESRIRSMPNGIDVDAFSSLATKRPSARRALGLAEAFTFLHVGRFAEVKNHAALVTAFARLVDEGKDCRLLLVGSGPLEGTIGALIKRFNLAGRVRCLGPRDDIADLMIASDALVLPSKFEGLPMVLLEAAASGLPAIATDVGGNASIVRHGETGLLVPAESVDSLAEAMRELISTSVAVRTLLGVRARAHVRAEFSLDAIVDRWEELYESLLEQTN